MYVQNARSAAGLIALLPEAIPAPYPNIGAHRMALANLANYYEVPKWMPYKVFDVDFRGYVSQEAWWVNYVFSVQV
jgi:hypothetical protein